MQVLFVTGQLLINNDCSQNCFRRFFCSNFGKYDMQNLISKYLLSELLLSSMDQFDFHLIKKTKFLFLSLITCLSKQKAID